MAAPSKTKKFEQLVKLLQKRFKGLSAPQERPVLDQLIYAALLENASYEQADAAFTVLENYFIDWNEIRVSTVSELADVFTMLPNPQAAGDRIRRTLQAVFEKTYMFDLEELAKKNKNLGQSVEFLESLSACSRFMVDYVTQVSLGGHVIPLDEAALRIFRLLGLTQVNKDRTKEEVPGLERAVPKKNGSTVSLQLHHFAIAYFADPESAELRALLKTIDAEAMKRDWTPPVLVVPKAQQTKETKSVIAPLPFVAADEDDFDEDNVGMEAEFISDDSDYENEDSEPTKRRDIPVDSANERQSSGKKEDKKKKEKSAEKKPITVKVEEKTKAPKIAPLEKKTASALKETASKPVKSSKEKPIKQEKAKIPPVQSKKNTVEKKAEKESGKQAKPKPTKPKPAAPAKKSDKQTDKKSKPSKKEAVKPIKKATKSKKPR